MGTHARGDSARRILTRAVMTTGAALALLFVLGAPAVAQDAEEGRYEGRYTRIEPTPQEVFAEVVRAGEDGASEPSEERFVYDSFDSFSVSSGGSPDTEVTSQQWACAVEEVLRQGAPQSAEIEYSHEPGERTFILRTTADVHQPCGFEPDDGDDGDGGDDDDGAGDGGDGGDDGADGDGGDDGAGDDGDGGDDGAGDDGEQEQPREVTPAERIDTGAGGSTGTGPGPFALLTGLVIAAGLAFLRGAASTERGR